MIEPSPAPAHPAATVVLLREGSEGCEALLVRRNARLSFHGGAWVFPGGRIDPEDHAAAGTNESAHAARYAAAREAFEEAGVTITPDSLMPFSRWVTPEVAPKRFDAWFFAAPASVDVVRVDGGEIHEHRWMRPIDALEARHVGAIDLPPPTFVTLSQLAAYRTVREALEELGRRPFDFFVPRVHLVPDGACSLYHGDVAYDSDDIDQPGARHRLWMRDSGWSYERTKR